METSKTLTGQQSSDQTLFAVDTPVNHLAPQANEEAQTIQDTCGLGSETPLANYDPPTQSWRTSEDISLWGDYKLLENLPKSGMTQNGALYQQPAWVRPIDETALSLWPTPTTQEVEHPNAELTATGRRKSKNGKTSHSVGLADAVQIWPTPTARDYKGAAGFKNPQRNLRDLTYLAQIKDGHRLMEYPTMSANGMGNTGSQEILQRKVESGEITKEEKKRMTAGNGGSLNPMWVEWLMGFPTGWTDLED